MNPFGVILVISLLTISTVTGGSTNLLRSSHSWKTDSSEESSVPAKRYQSRDYSAIPDTFDARTNWANCPSIAEVPNQGCCNGNYAIVPTAVLTDRACIATNSSDLVFSPTDPISCCRKCASTNYNGCLGGSPVEVWKYAAESGIASRNCLQFPLPFVGCLKAAACPVMCTSGEKGRTVDDTRHTSYPYYQVSYNVADIQMEIMTYGPVEAEMSLYVNFANYDGKTVYTVNDNDSSNVFLGMHSVKIIGWGKEKEAQYWLVINTFGKIWGSEGTAKVLMGQNTAGIEMNVRAAMPNMS